MRERFAALRSALWTCVGEMFVAQLFAYAGDSAATAAQLAIVRAQPMFAAMTDPVWLSLLAAPSHLVRDVALAEALYPVLLPRADELVFVGPTGGYVDVPYALELARLCVVLGREAEATERYQQALALLERVQARSHMARARCELARVLSARAGAADVERARQLLAEARSLAAELGQARVLELVAETALAPSPPRAPAAAAEPSPRLTIVREGDTWCLSFGARSVRLRDSRGMQVLARLVAAPEQELHVLQLAGDIGAPRDGGDAGPQLDDAAVQGYRRRLLELREALAEAESFNDGFRAERAQREIDLLTRELSRALGLGDRARRVGAPAERARTAVQKRLKNTIDRIAETLPELARHLDGALHTGTICAYFPDGRPRGRRA
ncbi:MAG: hypothetical protein U1F43_19735 [Myxococcota bacterium]